MAALLDGGGSVGQRVGTRVANAAASVEARDLGAQFEYVSQRQIPDVRVIGPSISVTVSVTVSSG